MFELPENLDHPYVSQSVSEFWRRWHMTLGGWFREYVYIPLGGNRKGRLCTVRNLAIVWVLTGMWHGASWNFAFWGAYYAVLIILEKLFLQKVLGKSHPFRWLYSFLAAAIGGCFPTPILDRRSVPPCSALPQAQPAWGFTPC
ncbi:MAG: MBOAT family O-acyltransferase [Hydrogeniiclostridium mannosilyticum]